MPRSPCFGSILSVQLQEQREMHVTLRACHTIITWVMLRNVLTTARQAGLFISSVQSIGVSYQCDQHAFLPYYICVRDQRRTPSSLIFSWRSPSTAGYAERGLEASEGRKGGMDRYNPFDDQDRLRNPSVSEELGCRRSRHSCCYRFVS